MSLWSLRVELSCHGTTTFLVLSVNFREGTVPGHNCPWIRIFAYNLFTFDGMYLVICGKRQSKHLQRWGKKNEYNTIFIGTKIINSVCSLPK